MNDSNPYESPQNIEELSSKSSKQQPISVRAEVLRGAKLGAVTAILFLVAAMIVCFVLDGLANKPFQYDLPFPVRNRMGVIQWDDHIFVLIYGTLVGMIVGTVLNGLPAIFRK